MDDALKIYLSSTVEDLKTYRERVITAIRRMGDHVLDMEQYVSNNAWPWDRSLTDVAACDVYLGIVAWRYGVVPQKDNPKRLSITELEYERAREYKKPCLIFILSKDAPWPMEFVDNDRTPIERFRSRLTQELTVSHFNSEEDLQGQVFASLAIRHNAISPIDVTDKTLNIPPPPEDLPPPLEDRVSTQSDDPAREDELQRRPFAEVIGARIQEVWDAQRGEQEDAGAFMVHIHGPWGSGKSTILNFLRQFLQDDQREKKHRWVVIDFNAWRQQRLKPPWWSLIHQIYRQAMKQLPLWRRSVLQLQWLWWRARADWFPVFSAALLLLIAGLVAFIGESDTALKLIVAVTAVGAGIAAYSRSLVFGSSRAAQAYTDLRDDPLSPIVRLFSRLVRAIRRPVVVFVDDLDRCDTAYVVELLEGIQTLFRSNAITYVVAADRKWICRSFDKVYEPFSGTIGESGRPLGYLFLEKVFQVSAPVPRLSPKIRDDYWTALLQRQGANLTDQQRKNAEAEAQKSVSALTTKEQLERKIAEVKGDPLREPAMRAAAAKQITSVEAQKATEHRLQRFAELVEPNPRAMKRLVNAYGLHQATHFLEGRNVSAEGLARWTIIELRWPLLADHLANNPEAAEAFADNAAPTGVPKDLKKLFTDAEVRKVVGSGALDKASIRQIVSVDLEQQ